MSALPSVFISHGSPMHALQPGPAGEAWKALGGRLRIESAPGSTRLEACIPLPRAAGHVPEDDLGAAAA